MQAVKDKLHDISVMRKAKAEAKAEEKAEKELAKARVEVAHEVRLAREAEAAMDLHVAKAGMKAEKEMTKYANTHTHTFVAPGGTAALDCTADMAVAPGVTIVNAPGTVNMAGAPPVNKKLL
ncbi:late embryogenesis abundant protein 6-like [Benincasa hispida]|uniref:late embryogenesis abundant protein 6-like n=1 Tax=Benincasa hispida TaxID=102211 RepID=UPI0018FFB81B|nr:late embryogenesis abundant protein 6-like [Benincasa hispida]